MDISSTSESDIRNHNEAQEEVVEEGDNEDSVIVEAQRRERVPCEDWLKHWLY